MEQDNFEKKDIDIPDGCDEEQLYSSPSDEIKKPFDPRMVDIISVPMVISNVVNRLKYNEIILDPDFQRNPNLWDKGKQSRLIESLLIRIPLPTFYFNDTGDDKLIVVDGLQRLNAIKNFMVCSQNDRDCLKLEGLEYLSELEGKYYHELKPQLQRRLNEQSIQTYLIRSDTPDKVRTSIFERINTGGMTLNEAEIRNSVYHGSAAELLKELANSDEFKKVTRNSIRSDRMADRELVNRFLAFYLLGLDEYEGNIKDFLDAALKTIKDGLICNLAEISSAFKKAMELSYKLFGRNAFRKKNVYGHYGKINKPLFEVVSVQFAKLNDNEILKINKDKFLNAYEKLMKNGKFIEVITNGTARQDSIKYRHSEFKRILKESME